MMNRTMSYDMTQVCCCSMMLMCMVSMCMMPMSVHDAFFLPDNL